MTQGPQAAGEGRPKLVLSERDISYLKLLKTLKSAGGGGGGGSELGVVRRIAAWMDSVAVLEFIAAHAPWYDDWEVKEGLHHNDLTPARFRREIEKSIAIFDLLRELDDKSLPAEEKAEIQEDVRYLIKTLSEHDRMVVKRKAHDLAAGGKGAAGPVAAMDAAAEAPSSAPPQADSLLAAEVSDLVETGTLPADGSVTGVLHETEKEAWTRVPPADPEPSADPGAVLAEPETAASETDAPADPAEVEAEAPADPAAAEAPADPAAAEVPAQSSAAEVPAQPAAAEAPADPAAAEVPAQPAAAEASADMPSVEALGAGEKIELASTSRDTMVLSRLAHEHDEAVQLALLKNPAFTPGAAAVLARHAGQRAAAELHRQRRLFSQPIVQKALLECPNATSASLLEVVNGISQLNELLRLIRNPKVKFLEVKAKARARLAMIFKSMGPNEKIAAIRGAGRGILKELWTDFFRDEQLVIKCLQEKQVDEGIVHEIARSKVAPRKALEIIGTNPGWTNNYQIRLDLVMNPKTPRQVVTRLIRKLNPADRKMVKNNPAIPESVRRYA